jgi:phosphopentomutase
MRLRTPGRCDFTLRRPDANYLDALQKAGVDVHGVRKIANLFAGVGIAHLHAGATNAQTLRSTDDLLERLECVGWYS